VVVVNFGDREYETQMGGKKQVLGKNGYAVKGPKVDQYLELVK
jgi:hypothetical protein